MKQINATSLMYFQSELEEHANILQKNKNYNFRANFDAIKELFKGDRFDREDLVEYISEDKFMMGIDFVDDDLDDWKYIFDAFSVYWCSAGSIYFKHSELTAKWRKIMKEAYPNSKYVQDLKNEIEKERAQRIAEINAEIDKEIENA